MQRFKEKTGERYPKSSNVRNGSLLDVLILVRDKYTMRCVNDSRTRCNDRLSNVHAIDDIARHKLRKYDRYLERRWDKLLYGMECDE